MKSSSRQEKSLPSHNKSIAVAILPKRDPNNSWASEKHPDTKNSFFWFTWNYFALKEKKNWIKFKFYPKFPASLRDLAVFFHIKLKPYWVKRSDKIPSEYH